MSIEEKDIEESPKRKTFPSLFTTCPPIPPISTIIALALLVIFVYGSLVGLVGDDALAGGPVFALYVLVIICYLGGQLVSLVKIPTIVGMMVFGFILRNVPQVNVAKDIPETWAGNIRNIALIFILLRAGLEVDSSVIKNNKSTCCKIIVIPFLLEFFMVTLAGHYLFSMLWTWSFLLGAILSAVSPAIVLPVMLKMIKKGYGTASGIPSMVVAVAGIDDVLSLTAFQVVLGITFSTGAIVWTILQGPVEILIGITYGILVGMLLWFIPNSEERSKSILRFMLLVLSATCIFFGSLKLKAGSAGALGCICLPFTAALNWKKKDYKDYENPVEQSLEFIWRFIEPLLFGLIGSDIRMDYLQAQTIGLGLATMFVGLISRMIGSMIAAYFSGFSLKEQIFITVAGMPKATVQAALGSIPLAMARKHHLGTDIEQYGIEILTMAVLAIFITAPIGAIAISVLAPNLLKVDSPNELDEKVSREITDNSNVSMYGSVHSSNISEGDDIHYINNRKIYNDANL